MSEEVSCPFCRNSFARPWTLKNHIRAFHTAESVCGKLFPDGHTYSVACPEKRNVVVSAINVSDLPGVPIWRKRGWCFDCFCEVEFKGCMGTRDPKAYAAAHLCVQRKKREVKPKAGDAAASPKPRAVAAPTPAPWEDLLGLFGKLPGFKDPLKEFLDDYDSDDEDPHFTENQVKAFLRTVSTTLHFASKSDEIITKMREDTATEMEALKTEKRALESTVDNLNMAIVRLTEQKDRLIQQNTELKATIRGMEEEATTERG